MTIYDEMQALGREILGEFPQGVIQLVRSVPGAGPADAPGAPTETTHTLDAVAKGVSYKFVQNGLALATDRQVTAAVLEGVTPNPATDFIVIDGARHKIVADVSAPAAGTKAVWKFIVRKGG